MVVNQSSSNMLDLTMPSKKVQSNQKNSLSSPDVQANQVQANQEGKKSTDFNTIYNEVNAKSSSSTEADELHANGQMSAQSDSTKTALTKTDSTAEHGELTQGFHDGSSTTSAVENGVADNMANTVLDSNAVADDAEHGAETAEELADAISLNDKLTAEVVSDQLQSQLTQNVVSEVSKMAQAPHLAMGSAILSEQSNVDKSIQSQVNPASFRQAKVNQNLASQTLLNQALANQSNSSTPATERGMNSQVSSGQVANASAHLLDTIKSSLETIKPSQRSLDVTATLANSTMQNAVDGEQRLMFKVAVAQDNKSSMSELSQKLQSILADKLNVQLSSKTSMATIRLDPADLGKIDMTVRLDNDKLQIQIAASSGQTREAIQMTADRLRHELVNQNFLSVEVSVSSGGEPSDNQYQQGVDGYAISSSTFGEGDDEQTAHTNSTQLTKDALARA